MAKVILNRQTFKIGEYLFKTGDAPLCAYLIQSGTVDIVVGNEGDGPPGCRRRGISGCCPRG